MLVGLGAVILTEIGRHVYRPFIYASGMYDFHIADTMGNSFGTVATIFVLLAFFGRDQDADRRIILSATVGTALFELGSPLLGKPIDPWDVSATLIAGAASGILARRLHQT
jgi:hypothetical protein